MSYTSNRTFQMWAYSVSHSFLILRSSNNEDDEVLALNKGYNIDIEFVGVSYLDLPSLLNGITIEEIEENIPEKFAKYSKYLGYRVFEIKTLESTHYIVAGSYCVGKNNWLEDDRIKNLSLSYDEILSKS